MLSYTSNENYVEHYSNNIAIKEWLLSTTKIQSISDQKRLKKMKSVNEDPLFDKFKSSFERFSFANTSIRSVRTLKPIKLKKCKKKKLKKPIIYLEEPSLDFVNIPIIKVRYYADTDDNVNSSVESTRSLSMYSNDDFEKNYSDIN